MYMKSANKDLENPPELLAHEKVNEYWEVACALSRSGFQQVSFVNNIATSKGGRHVDYITGQIVKEVVNFIKKRDKDTLTNIKPFQVNLLFCVLSATSRTLYTR